MLELELVSLVVLATIAVFARGLRAVRSRVLILAAAAAMAQVGALLYVPSFIGAPDLLRAGIAWVLTCDLLALQRRTIATAALPLFVVATWFVQVPIHIVLALVSVNLTGNAGIYNDYYSQPTNWLPSFGALMVLASVAQTFVMFLIAQRLARTYGPSQPEIYSGIAYGGIQMSPSKSEATRLLAASAVLLGSRFRRQILDQLRDANYAAPPELGLDLKLVAQVCTAMERRSRTHDWLFAAALPAWLVLYGVGVPLATALVVTGTALLYFSIQHRQRAVLARAFAKSAYDPEQVERTFDAPLDPEVAAGLPHPDSNLVVYRDFRPFVGSGINLGGWSFTVNVDKPKDGPFPATPQPFGLGELYDAIDRGIEELSLGGFAASDIFFVSGTDLRDDRSLLPNPLGRPIDSLPPDAARRYRNTTDPRVRHYRWFRIHDWGNELVVSHFFRCALRGRTMFVEIDRFLLTPVAEQYRRVDSQPAPTGRHALVLAASSVVLGPISVLVALVSLHGRLQRALDGLFGGTARARRREIEDNPLFNYGAPRPVRETCSSDKFGHYFQKVDADFYNKVFDRQLLDAICEFLDDHDIDTSDLRERQNTILNSGIIVQGGDVRADNLAVGTGATATRQTGSSRLRGLKTQEKTA